MACLCYPVSVLLGVAPAVLRDAEMHLIPLLLYPQSLFGVGGPLLHLYKASEMQSRELPVQPGGCEPPGFWPAELSALDPLSLMLILLSYLLANTLVISLV